ncbi:MAG: ASKHA domain-containing protein [Archaeoglobaceae archaeon]
MKILFEPMGKVAEGSGSIIEIARASGVSIRSDCGGKGICGKCKVLVIKGKFSELTEHERKKLNETEIKQGYRLSCQAEILSDATVFVPAESRGEVRKIEDATIDKEVELNPAVVKIRLKLNTPTLEDPKPDVERLSEAIKNVEIPLSLLRKLPDLLRSFSWDFSAVLWKNRLIAIESPNSEIYGVAVDIGSSKIVCHLVNLANGKTIAKAFAENPQVAYGEDVVSRITYAKKDENLAKLQRIVVETVNDLITKLCKEAGISKENVYEVMVVGNSVMHHLFFGITPKFIGVSPFIPAVRRSISYPANEVGLRIAENGIVTSLPLIAGFIGADATANLLLTEIYKSEEIAMVIDVGTNTEIILGNRERVIACSTPSGPAFEGAHISSGMKAVSGAIEKIRIKDEDVFYSTIDNKKPKGICGSGLIDLIAELYKNNYINKFGKFKRDGRRIVHEEVPKFVVAFSDETEFGKSITVTEKDINEFLLAKASIKAGWSILAKRFNVEPEKIEKIYLAGSFGKHIDIENARLIGLLPKSGEIVFAGDSAVAGAKIALKSIKKREEIEEVVKKVEYVELSIEKDFQTTFLRSIPLG